MTPSARYTGLFIRALLMSVVQAGGVVLLAQHSPYALGTAFLISWMWAGNSRAIVDYRLPWSRFWYGLGGCAGTGLVLLVAWWLR